MALELFRKYGALTDCIGELLSKMASAAIIGAVKLAKLSSCGRIWPETEREWSGTRLALLKESGDLGDAISSLTKLTECGVNFPVSRFIDEELRKSFNFEIKGVNRIADIFLEENTPKGSDFANWLLCSIIERVEQIQEMFKGLPKCGGDVTRCKCLDELLLDAFFNVSEESYADAFREASGDALVRAVGEISNSAQYEGVQFCRGAVGAYCELSRMVFRPPSSAVANAATAPDVVATTLPWCLSFAGYNNVIDGIANRMAETAAIATINTIAPVREGNGQYKLVVLE
ncbi:MAG: hypothetical protein LBI39_01800 [Puniceicoccales bacterium]|nr:hypothetical protein [Puniceicoccales bacterium]